MSNPLISIIVPVYNTEKYLNRCVDSILAQTFTDFELILFDDGSTDQSGEICDEYAKKDSRITVLHERNHGVSYSRNIGLDNSRGAYIAFIDSDDYVSQNYLMILYNLLYKYPEANYASCSFKNFSDVNEIVQAEKTSSESKEVLFDVCDDIDNYRKISTQLVWGSIYKRDSLNINGRNLRFNESISNSEDVLFNLSVYCNSKSFVRTFDELYYYFYREDSAVNSEFNKKKLSELDALNLMIKSTKKFPNIQKNKRDNYIALSLTFMEKTLTSNIGLMSVLFVKKHMMKNFFYMLFSKNHKSINLYYFMLCFFPYISHKLLKIV